MVVTLKILNDCLQSSFNYLLKGNLALTYIYNLQWMQKTGEKLEFWEKGEKNLLLPGFEPLTFSAAAQRVNH